jgi:hypothetical protein
MNLLVIELVALSSTTSAERKGGLGFSPQKFPLESNNAMCKRHDDDDDTGMADRDTATDLLATQAHNIGATWKCLL